MLLLPRGLELEEVVEVELLLIDVVAQLALELVDRTAIAQVFADDLRALGEEVSRLRGAMCALSVVEEDEVGVQLRFILQLVEVVGGEGVRVVVIVARAGDAGLVRLL